MTYDIKPTNLQYQDFAKLDIRVGTIQRAEPIPKAKKLLKLEVFFGEVVGLRTIVAGLAGSYDPTLMGGIQVVAVLNLAPRVMMGIQSDGMVLATHHEGQVRLIVPSAENISDGSEVA
jgi:methionyl-tRNA synthetase